MKMTYHCQYERKDRIEFIRTTIGFGQTVKESYNNGCRHKLTDTGIVLIVDDDNTTIITAYVATMRDAMMIYGASYKKMPSWLRKKIDHNQSLYTANGKTVVR